MLQVAGKWSERSAGGNHTCATFMNNPQYRIVVSPDIARPNVLAELSITCETAMGTPVNVKLLRGKGERVAEFVPSAFFFDSLVLMLGI